MDLKVIDVVGYISNIEASGCGEYIYIDHHGHGGCKVIEEIINEHDLVGKVVDVRYWITNEMMSKEEAIEVHVKTLLGIVEGEYRSGYSECTGYMVFEETLSVGGHDLVQELRNNDGKYLILEITVHD